MSVTANDNAAANPMVQGAEIEGRQFHNVGSNYSLPADSAEHRRLGIQHEALKLTVGSNCLAPVHEYLRTNSTRVLDLCCGSGHWVIDMANDYPLTEAIGLDIVSPKPGIQMPKNCKFVLGDAQKSLPFEDVSFDLVQMRTVPSVPDRTLILKEIARILRPGGYVALIEPYESFSAALGTRTPAAIETDRLLALSPHAPRAREEENGQKKSWSCARDLVPFLEAARDENSVPLFENVEYKTFELPIGAWAEDEKRKKVGTWMGEVQLALLGNFRPVFVKHNLITPEGFDALEKEMGQEVADFSLQLSTSFTYAWARRV